MNRFIFVLTIFSLLTLSDYWATYNNIVECPEKYWWVNSLPLSYNEKIAYCEGNPTARKVISSLGRDGLVLMAGAELFIIYILSLKLFETSRLLKVPASFFFAFLLLYSLCHLCGALSWIVEPELDTLLFLWNLGSIFFLSGVMFLLGGITFLFAKFFNEALGSVPPEK